ncbi:MAG: hypothetical protein COT91_03660 [Candidatus Doudnabacteria bacterium CG10_big_fil_rev_8_21_14_0_10_41_10]|uniref:Uncharacterized protein n=1 Tax=Candidatus Doudnabacteria bacterium CG10_big_fil_rev_8_21_14_0_10_41_10 TaxID=1974551 RepID=A0A2H0VD48_9BACT|nr:MAG: hypothetical protein COT91_03660 [Candidatus Doudnabacteria bacterium CG10_big_fil_rev_8_21_14_0_10_41_10]
MVATQMLLLISKKMEFKALERIPKNKEIIYNYLTTEYDMRVFRTDFECKCGSKKFFKRIKGFKYLSKYKKNLLKFLFSPYLLPKINNK